MSPHEINTDELLKSEEFKETIRKADVIARNTDRDTWPVRVGLVSLMHGPWVTRRYVSRRQNYQNTQGWLAYQRLCMSGIIHGGRLWWSEEDHGETDWGQDPYAWLFAMIDVAAGEPVPATFPVYQAPLELTEATQ